MSDAPAAGAMPAASQRRRVGHGAVVFAVGPPGNRTAAEAKIRVPRIAARPAADPWGERARPFRRWSDLGRRGRLPRRAPRRTVPAPARPRRGAGGSGLALPFVRAGIATAACSTWSTVTAPQPGGGAQCRRRRGRGDRRLASAGCSAGRRRTAGRRGVVRCRARRVSRGIRSWPLTGRSLPREWP